MRTSFRRMLGVAAVIVLAGVSGCSGADDEGQSVSRADYYAAAQKAAQCMRDAGLTGVTEPADTWGVTYTVGWGGENKNGDAVHDRCWRTIAQPVEDRYLESLELSGKAWEDKYREFIGCLEEAGVEGVEVGDEEGKVGTAIGDSMEGERCMQYYMWYLFRGKNTGINAE